MTNCPELRLVLSLPDPNGTEQLTSTTTGPDVSAEDCCSNLNQQSLSAATAEANEEM